MQKFKFQTENTERVSHGWLGGEGLFLSLMEVTFSLLIREDAFQITSKASSREQQPCYVMFLHLMESCSLVCFFLN